MAKNNISISLLIQRYFNKARGYIIKDYITKKNHFNTVLSSFKLGKLKESFKIEVYEAIYSEKKDNYLI